MYNLLLVDDEPAVVKGLAYDIEWSDLNVSGVYKAYGAAEAIARMEGTRIDIVVSDITMPDMDGITLAQSIRGRWPSAVVLFLSGRDDFEFAQKAIELGVFQYATKPVDYGQLKETVRKAIRKLENELVRDNALRAARESLDRVRPLLRERAISAWLVKGMENPLANADRFEAAGLRFGPEDVFAPVVVRTEGDGAAEGESDIVRELAVKELAAEWLIRGEEGLFFPNERGQWLLLFRASDEEECAAAVRHMEKAAESFKESVKRTLGFAVSLFFGETARTGQVLDAYRKLESLVRRTPSDDTGVIVLAGQPATAALAGSRFPLKSLSESPELSLLLDKLELAKCMERIDCIFAEAGRNLIVDEESLLEIFHAVSGAVIQASHRRGMAMSKWAGERGELLQPFRAVLRASDLQKWCRQVVEAFVGQARKVEKKQSNRLIGQAKALVEENCTRDVSVAEIASMLYVHPNYLSRVFKAETGLSVIDYISKKRIERARQLLAEPGIKVYEVAEKVGYESIAHFNRMFKRETGMGPKEFQRTLINP